MSDTEGKITLENDVLHGMKIGEDGAIVFTGITRAEAVAATGGGSGAWSEDMVNHYADKIEQSAAGNAAWRSSRGGIEQLVLSGTPVIHVPPTGDDDTDSSAKGDKPSQFARGLFGRG